jgi:hypothetical protein
MYVVTESRTTVYTQKKTNANKTHTPVCGCRTEEGKEAAVTRSE